MPVCHVTNPASRARSALALIEDQVMRSSPLGPPDYVRYKTSAVLFNKGLLLPATREVYACLILTRFTRFQFHAVRAQH